MAAQCLEYRVDRSLLRNHVDQPNGPGGVDQLSSDEVFATANSVTDAPATRTEMDG